MKRHATLLMSLCLVFSWAHAQDQPPEKRRPIGTCTAAPTGEGWVDLLDADHVNEWREPKENRDIFAVEDGVLSIPGNRPFGYVGYMKEEFGDFQLHIEFKVTERTNSGVIFRAGPEDPPFSGMEIQVYDDHGAEPSRTSSGSVFDVATPMFNMSLPRGEWNSFDITCKGDSLVVLMNGWKILDIDLSKMTMPIGKFDTPYAELPKKGFLFVQDHGHPVWYRNIFLKKLQD